MHNGNQTLVNSTKVKESEEISFNLAKERGELDRLKLYFTCIYYMILLSYSLLQNY